MSAQCVQRSRTKWISVVGARPHFIKLAPLCRAIAEHNCDSPGLFIDHQVVQTSQHFDHELAAMFFRQMDIEPPKYSLGVGSGSCGTQLARMLARIEPILCSQQPDWVIVYGDTNSTLAGALLAARLRLQLAHVEAGCRSGDLQQPEEQNRVLTDHLSQLLFAASHKCATTLCREGIALGNESSRRRVCVVGDILRDALLQYCNISDQDANQYLSEFGLTSKEYYLLALQGAENLVSVNRLRGILDGVSSLGIPVVFPVDPRTSRLFADQRISINGDIISIAAQGYSEMLTLEKHALKILTDSGGVQREAFYLGVPCITLRDHTEWVETVEAGANRLVAPCLAEIRAAVFAQSDADWQACAPYGDGTAAQKIVAELLAATPQARSQAN